MSAEPVVRDGLLEAYERRERRTRWITAAVTLVFALVALVLYGFLAATVTALQSENARLRAVCDLAEQVP